VKAKSAEGKIPPNWLGNGFHQRPPQLEQGVLQGATSREGGISGKADGLGGTIHQ